MQVTWKTALLRVHPIVITLDGIALTASPRAEDEWATEPAERRAQALKRAALAVAAELATQMRVGGGVASGAAAGAVASEAGAGYGPIIEAMWAPVLDRLQLKVGSVHVRFMDVPRRDSGGGGGGGNRGGDCGGDGDGNRAVHGDDVASFGLRMDSLEMRTASIRDAAAASGEAQEGVGIGTGASKAAQGSSRDGRGGGRSSVDGTGWEESTTTGNDHPAAAAEVYVSGQSGVDRAGAGGGQTPQKSTSDRKTSTSTFASLLSMVAPIGEARKLIEITGLRVYGHTVKPRLGGPGDGSTVKGASENMCCEWCPVGGEGMGFTPPEGGGGGEGTGVGGGFGFLGGHDDQVNLDDVMVGAEILTALLTVTARPKVSAGTRRGAVGAGASGRGEMPGGRRARAEVKAEVGPEAGAGAEAGVGFHVHLRLDSAVGVRVRPNQLRSAVRLGDALAVWKLRERHGGIRPTARPSGGPRRHRRAGATGEDATCEDRRWGEWWRYAGRAVVNDIAAGYTRGHTTSKQSAAAAGDGGGGGGRVDVPAKRGEWKKTPALLRYVKLYRKKLRRELSAGFGWGSEGPATALDGSVELAGAEGDDTDIFYDCETPTGSSGSLERVGGGSEEGDGSGGSTWPSVSAALHFLENELSLEELLDARGKAELSLHLDPDDDDFLDCNDDKSEEGEETDEDEDEGGDVEGEDDNGDEADLGTRRHMSGSDANESGSSAGRLISDGLSTPSNGSGGAGEVVKQRGTISWAAAAVFRRGEKLLSSAVGLAASAASAAVQIVSDNSDRATDHYAAFTLEARSVLLTVCADAEGSGVSTSGSDDALIAAKELFRVELTRAKVESGTVGPARNAGNNAVSSGVEFRICIDDVEGWVLGGTRGSDGDGDGRNTKAIWRRRDIGGGGDATGPAVCVLKRTAVAAATLSDDSDECGGGPQGAGGSGSIQLVTPLEVSVAPLVILLHPQMVAALMPFTEEVPGTHHLRTLSAVCGLPGGAPRERLARAAASIDLEMHAQPWRVVVSQPLLLLPSAGAAGSVAGSAAAALEMSRLEMEWTSGGKRMLTVGELEEVRKRAEDAVQNCDRYGDGNGDGNVEKELNEALRTIEEAATTHQASVSVSGARVSVPVLRSPRAGGDVVWSPLFDGWGGSMAAVMKSLAVGGPGAANRVRLRLSPLCLSLTPAIAAALASVGAAGGAVGGGWDPAPGDSKTCRLGAHTCFHILSAFPGDQILEGSHRT